MDHAGLHLHPARGAGAVLRHGNRRRRIVFVQAGVGALAASVVGFYSALFPNDPPLFVVVEPDKAACVYESIKAGDGKCHPSRAA